MTGPRSQKRTEALYDLQWNRFRIVRDDEDAATFAARTALTADRVRDAVILDAGCGMGRYARVADGLGPRLVIGLDLSWALLAARETTRACASVALARGDLLRPPIAEASCDHIYSIGVLDHTPDPRRAFLNLARCLKPGGRIVIWVYRRERPVLERMKSAQRALSTRMPLGVLLAASRLMAPVGGLKRRMSTSRSLLVRRAGVALHVLTIGVSMHPDPEVRVCDTLDWYAPKFMSRHTDDEVRGWFAEAGLVDIEDLSAHPALFHAGQGHGVNLAGRRPG